MNEDVTVISAVWSGQRDKEALLRGHMENLDRQTQPHQRIYVFDQGDTPPDWLRGMAVTVRERGDERFRRYRLMFTSYIETLLGEFQADGKLSASLDLPLAANLIHVLHSENFDNFCTVKELTVADALSMARGQLALLLNGWIVENAGGKPPRGRKPKSR